MMKIIIESEAARCYSGGLQVAGRRGFHGHGPVQHLPQTPGQRRYWF